ncbi:MAG: glycosyltransferase family 2 protein [Dehalococcoidia bacterium]|nr:glycosyltransferase family 2 protein [Dehalococcoidia bacterium]
MRVGIVIVTYRCRELALRCLASIEHHSPHLLETTAVVDNASNDGTLGAVASGFPAVRRVAMERNAGFASGVNAGMRALVDCDAICLLNPDAELLDGNLEKAAEWLDGAGDAGIAGLGIENPDGSLQLSCRAFPSHRTAVFNRHSLATKLLPSNRWSREYLLTDRDHEHVQEVNWVSGAAMLIHRRAIERVGMLDEGYFFSIEDVDYCKRAHDAGLRVVYLPMTRVRHRIGGSSRHAAYRAMFEHHRGMWRYYRTHMAGGLAVDVITAGGISARFGLHAVSLTVRRLVGRDGRRGKDSVPGRPPR